MHHCTTNTHQTITMDLNKSNNNNNNIYHSHRIRFTVNNYIFLLIWYCIWGQDFLLVHGLQYPLARNAIIVPPTKTVDNNNNNNRVNTNNNNNNDNSSSDVPNLRNLSTLYISIPIAAGIFIVVLIFFYHVLFKQSNHAIEDYEDHGGAIDIEGEVNEPTTSSSTDRYTRLTNTTDDEDDDDHVIQVRTTQSATIDATVDVHTENSGAASTNYPESVETFNNPSSSSNLKT